MRSFELNHLQADLNMMVPKKGKIHYVNPALKSNLQRENISTFTKLIYLIIDYRNIMSGTSATFI